MYRSFFEVITYAELEMQLCFLLVPTESKESYTCDQDLGLISKLARGECVCRSVGAAQSKITKQTNQFTPQQEIVLTRLNRQNYT